MSKILMLKGLPASGKSTYAKELVARGGWKRVNKDDLRAMLDNGKWSRGNEKFVLEVRNMLIAATVKKGRYSVIVDDTNFNPVHEAELRSIADEFKVPFEVKFFDTPLEECIIRDLKRPVSVGEKVIRDMYNQYLKPAPAVYEQPEGKPWAIICDIDGTLAHGIGETRFPHEYEKVETDSLDVTVRNIFNDASGVVKIVMSGRPETCREATVRWLNQNGVQYDHLYMRDPSRVDEKGNKVKDTIIKRELFDEHIRGQYRIWYVLDDRNAVVDMWRNEIGLKVLQVAEGDF